MLRRRAAATAEDVDLALVRPRLHQRCGGVWRFIVLAQLVGQAGIGIDHHQRIGELGQQLHMRAQLFRTEAAIEPDRHRAGMANRVPERLDRVARQVAARKVGQRHAHHDRHLAAQLALQLLHREDARLGVERVEHGLDQDEVRPALHQPGGLLPIDFDQMIEGDLAIAGVLDIGRERQGLVGRPDCTGNETRAAILRRVFIRQFARDAGGFDVDRVDLVFRLVVCLADRVGGEGVGRNDIRPRIQIGAGNVGDHIGPGQRENVVIALLVGGQVQIARIIRLGQLAVLDLRAERTIGYEDALGGLLHQGLAGVGHAGFSVGRMPSRWQIA